MNRYLPARIPFHGPAAIVALVLFLFLSACRPQNVSEDTSAAADSQAEQTLRLSQAEASWKDGNQSVNLGKYADAVAQFSDAINKNPDLAIAYLSRGNAELALRNYDAAETDYNSALSHDPKLASAYLARGTARWLLGDLSNAEADYRALVQLRPDDQFAATRFASVLFDEGKGQDVEAFFKGAYEASSDRTWALSGWLFAIEDNEGAEAALGKSNELYSSGVHDLEVRYMIGHEDVKTGRYVDAVHWLSELESEDPNKVPTDVAQELATAYKATGRPDLCFSTLEDYASRMGRELDDSQRLQASQSCNGAS